MSKLKKIIKEALIHPYRVCKPNQTQVKRLFKLINHEIFDDELEEFGKIIITKLDAQTLGTCDAIELVDSQRHCNLRIRKKYDNLFVFLETLIHEMVHSYHWLCEMRENLSHGKAFTRWQNKILKNWKIKI